MARRRTSCDNDSGGAFTFSSPGNSIDSDASFLTRLTSFYLSDMSSKVL